MSSAHAFSAAAWSAGTDPGFKWRFSVLRLKRFIHLPLKNRVENRIEDRAALFRCSLAIRGSRCLAMMARKAPLAKG
jgi:hypothetical protein